MEYEKFVEEVKRSMKENLPISWENSELSIVTVPKVNRTRMGILFRREGEALTPTIYLEELYEDYTKGMPLEEVVEKVQEVLVETEIKEKPSITWDWLKENTDKIIFQVINKLDNETYLEDVPHREFEDLAIVYSWIYVQGGCVMSVPITEKIREELDMSEEQLYQLSRENTKTQLPFVVKDVWETLSKDVWDFQDEIIDEDTKRKGERSFVITNPHKHYGANALLYPEVFEVVSERVQDDLYVIPYSRHQLMVIPKGDVTLETIRDMTETGYQVWQPSDERLSDRPYQYDKQEKKISMVSKQMIEQEKTRKEEGARR